MTVAVNTNTAKTSEIYGEKTEIIWGKESIQEGVLDYEFSLSPRAFYQPNPEQTEVLYNEAVKALDVTKEDHLIDAIVELEQLDLPLQRKLKHSEVWILFQKLLKMPSETLKNGI